MNQACFFFNLKFDPDNGELILGCGSEIEHMNLCMTPKYMMNHIGERGATCLDGTYSITSHDESPYVLRVVFLCVLTINSFSDDSSETILF